MDTQFENRLTLCFLLAQLPCFEAMPLQPLLRVLQLNRKLRALLERHVHVLAKRLAAQASCEWANLLLWEMIARCSTDVNAHSVLRDACGEIRSRFCKLMCDLEGNLLTLRKDGSVVQETFTEYVLPLVDVDGVSVSSAGIWYKQCLVAVTREQRCVQVGYGLCCTFLLSDGSLHGFGKNVIHLNRARARRAERLQRASRFVHLAHNYQCDDAYMCTLAAILDDGALVLSNRADAVLPPPNRRFVGASVFNCGNNVAAVLDNGHLMGWNDEAGLYPIFPPVTRIDAHSNYSVVVPTSALAQHTDLSVAHVKLPWLLLSNGGLFGPLTMHLSPLASEQNDDANDDDDDCNEVELLTAKHAVVHSPPHGRRFVDIVCTANFSVALLDDGNVKSFCNNVDRDSSNNVFVDRAASLKRALAPNRRVTAIAAGASDSGVEFFVFLFDDGKCVNWIFQD